MQSGFSHSKRGFSSPLVALSAMRTARTNCTQQRCGSTQIPRPPNSPRGTLGASLDQPGVSAGARPGLIAYQPLGLRGLIFQPVLSLFRGSTQIRHGDSEPHAGCTRSLDRPWRGCRKTECVWRAAARQHADSLQPHRATISVHPPLTICEPPIGTHLFATVVSCKTRARWYAARWNWTRTIDVASPVTGRAPMFAGCQSVSLRISFCFRGGNYYAQSGSSRSR